MERRSLGIIGALGCAFLLLVLLIPISLGVYALNRGDRGLLPNLQRATQIRNSPTQIVQVEPQPVSPTSQAPEDNQPVIPVTGSLAAVYQQVSPGVVTIGAQIIQEGQIGQAAGSGFILREDGYIVTNHHVVQGAEQISVVFFNGIDAHAEVVGSDPNSDLAILKVEQLVEGSHPLPLADSNQVMVGEPVAALGNPFGLGTSMSSGIVSAVGRVIPSGFTEFDIPQAIQTDAAINPGNSGGPLLNLNGEVIGVNAQIRTANGIEANTGVGFAIPSNILKLVSPSLIEQGSYHWPWIGITGLSVNGTIAEANNLNTHQGAYIAEVIPGSPADKAGLVGGSEAQDVNGIQVPVGGDVIIQADDQPITSFDQLLSYVAFKQPGDQVTFTVIRDGQQIQVPVTLEPRPE